MAKVVAKKTKTEDVINPHEKRDLNLLNNSPREITVIPVGTFKIRQRNQSGKPTKYRPIYCKWVVEYFENAEPLVAIVDDPGGKGGTQTKLETIRVPTLRGFSASIGIGKSTLYDWATQYPAFKDALARAQAMEHAIIEELGIAGKLAKGVTELYFMNHLEYKDSRSLDITSGGEKLPTPITALQLNVNSPSRRPDLIESNGSDI